MDNGLPLIPGCYGHLVAMDDRLPQIPGCHVDDGLYSVNINGSNNTRLNRLSGCIHFILCTKKANIARYRSSFCVFYY